MSSYYMCKQGEILRAALPSGLRPESESKVRICIDFEDDGSLDSHERLLFEVVKDQGEVCIGDLEMTGISERPLKILKQLIDKRAVEINETVRSGIPKRKVSYIQLSQQLDSEEAIHRDTGCPGQGTQTEGAHGALSSAGRNRSDRWNHPGIKKQADQQTGGPGCPFGAVEERCS